MSEQRLLAEEEGIDGVAYSRLRFRSKTRRRRCVLNGGLLEIDAVFRTPGPNHTEHSQIFARRFSGALRAYLALATGRVVHPWSFMMMIQTQPEKIENARERLQLGVPELWFSADDRQRAIPLGQVPLTPRCTLAS